MSRETETLCSALQMLRQRGLLHMLQRRWCWTTARCRGAQLFWVPCVSHSLSSFLCFLVSCLQKRWFFLRFCFFFFPRRGLENSEAQIFLNFPVKYLLSQTENASFISCLNTPTWKRSTEPQKSFSKQIPSHYRLRGHDCSQETWKSSYSKVLPIHVYLGLWLLSSD